jgi:hypothetical protein
MVDDLSAINDNGGSYAFYMWQSTGTINTAAIIEMTAGIRSTTEMPATYCVSSSSPLSWRP